MTTAIDQQPTAHDIDARCSPAAAATVRLQAAVTRLGERLRGDDTGGQFARFVVVGVVSNVLYALLFVLLSHLGTQPANLAGAVASSALANELHRRLTFRAGGRVTWLAAQWEGGGLAVVGIVSTTVVLNWFDTVAPGASSAASLAVIAAVTGAVGLIRFLALRWVFTGRAACCA